MKLHLPCALRGALLACFAFACAAPAWAATEVSIDGQQTDYLFKDADTYTIVPATDLIASGMSIQSISFKNTSTLAIGSSSSAFSAIEIESLAVNTGSNLTVQIAANTVVYLNDVKFNNKINYVLGDDSILFVSANDCTLGSISGKGTVYFTDGIINASTANLSGDISNWLKSAFSTSGGFLQSDITTLASKYTSSGTIEYDVDLGATVQFYTTTGNGSIESLRVTDYTYTYNYTWNGIGSGRLTVPTDPEVAVIDPDTEIYRNGTEDSKVWHLHYNEGTDSTTGQKTVSVQELLSKSLGDIVDAKYVTMGSTDTLCFEGSTLTSNKSVTLENPITSDGSAVRLAPDAGVTMTFTQGEGVLNGGNGLVLSGGSGSTVNLEGVTTAAPTGIEFTTGNTTLGIAGPEELTMDANSNIFQPTTKLSKLDGGKLIYLAKDGDTLGALTNTTGTVEIGSAVTQTVTTITAGALKLTTTGTNLTTTTTTVGDLELAYNYAKDAITLTTTKLVATGEVAVKYNTKLTADTIAANTLTLGSGGAVTATTSISAATATVGKDDSWFTDDGLTVGAINILGNGKQGTLTGMTLTSSALSNSSVSDALITVSESKTKASGTTLSLGEVSNTIITTNAAATLANTTLSNSKVTTNSDVTLDCVTIDPKTSFTAAAGTTATFSGQGVTLAPSAAITVGASTYTATDDAKLGSIQITSGSATESALTVNSAIINLPDVEAIDVDGPLTLLTGTGTVTGSTSESDILVYAAPGVAGTATYVGNTMQITLEDRSDEIISSLKHNGNTTAVADALLDNAVIRGTDTISKVYDYLRDFMRAGTQERQAVLDSLASGSITMLADSQRHGVVNTINRLRNRVVQMGNPQGIEMEHNIHAWVSADGLNNDIDEDGQGAGYEYQAWGGTLGVHADVGNFTFGASISASYGELTAHSADRAEADHDTFTVSGFARHQSGAWTQLGILSFGRNEIEMTRSLNLPRTEGESESYDAKGDASGHSITAYYEAGYTFTLGDEGTQVLQPHVSVMLTSARMGDLTETGSIGSAALCKDTDDFFYGTVGIGARYQVVLGTNVNHRISFLELRAKLVQDFGDETNETTVSFAGAPGQTFSLLGSDVGRTGVQLGAGVSVPVGVYTTLFADVDADIRSGATGVGGSAGIRVEF